MGVSKTKKNNLIKKQNHDYNFRKTAQAQASGSNSVHGSLQLRTVYTSVGSVV